MSTVAVSNDLPVVFLGSAGSPILTYLRELGEEIIAVGPDEPFAGGDGALVVTHGYRRILRPPPERGVNVHISYLPWNRGADPNLWSWIDGTPKGVTIHRIDEGVDTGNVIAQRRVDLAPTHTLASSYVALQAQALALFREAWPRIREGRANSRPQPQGGTFHRMADRQAVEHLLRRGWDTPVADLIR